MLTSDKNNEVNKWDEYAWQVLYETNVNRVYKAAYSIVLDEEMAEEITQITFMKAFMHINQLRDKGKFKSWICKIAVNTARDMLRQKITERNRSTSLYDDNGNMKEYKKELIDFNNPEEEYEAMEIMDKIISCINELNCDDRIIMHLRFIEGYTYEQIAEFTGINRSTVGTKILRAKQKISGKLEGYIKIEGERCYEDRMGNTEKR